jgi:hypothetical protein
MLSNLVRAAIWAEMLERRFKALESAGDMDGSRREISGRGDFDPD